jgi:DNA polymerase-3 subunit delta
LLEDLIGTGEPPLRLTFMIRRQFQLVARARALLERGTPQKELASRLKVPPFVARKLEEQGRKLDEEDLERALAQIQDLESGLKGGADLSDQLQVEMTVLRLSEASA